MNIEMRRHAALRHMLFALLLIPLFALAAPEPSVPSPRALPTDIAALQALRADPANPDYADAGIPLISAFLAERRFEEAKALAETLLATPSIDEVGEVKLLTAELDRRFQASDHAGLDVLEPRVQAASVLDSVDVNDRVRMLHKLVSVYSRIPRLADATAMLETMLLMLGDQPSEPLLTALRAKGAIHAMQGQFPEAIESLIGAQRVLTGLGRPEDPSILRNLAGISINLGEFDRAIAYAELAEEVQRTHPESPPARMGVLAVLATAHIGAHHFDEGRRWSQEALAFGREHKLPTSGVLNNYATLLRDEGRNAEALAAFMELLPQISVSDPPDVRGVVEKNIGETLVALNRRAEAAPHLQSARKLYETADVRPKRLELYPVLIENLEALGRTADALEAMHEFKALSDEVISTESMTRIGELENTIELANNEKALAESKAANELQLAENAALQASEARASAANLALIASLIAAAAILALLWRTYRIRTRSHHELGERNIEIEKQRNALEKLNTVIYQQSREDALTGLGNRRLLLESLVTNGNADTGVLVMADLDHFKTINDTHGHDTGDRALKLFADAMRAVGRQGDLLVRWGGEEFVWLCRGAAAGQGPALCERLLLQLREQTLDVDDQPLQVSASLGFVPLPVWTGTATDWDGALKIADYAVYCSKGSGRGGWTGFVGAGSNQGIVGDSPAALEERGLLRRVELTATKS